jgi:hypothetical protein
VVGPKVASASNLLLAAYYKQAKRIYVIPRSCKVALGGHTPEEASASETFVQFATLIYCWNQFSW